MGIFDIFKKKSDYTLFSERLNNVVEKRNFDNIEAFNFNIYEGSSTYDIQLVGVDKFEENNVDWACNTFFSCGEDICYIKRTEKIKDWKKALVYIKNMLKKYLSEGKNSKILKNAKAIGFGFVDGNIEFAYKK